LSQQVTWDLTELFSGIADPKINQAIAESTAAANTLEKTYRGKITSLSPEGLLKCLSDVETFETKFSDLTLFSSLSFSADMTIPQAQALNDKVDKLSANISKQLAFYSLELGKLVKSKPELIQEPALSNYRHMLERVYRRVEHQLSEVEEQLIIEKDQFGVNAWEELQSKVALPNLSVQVELQHARKRVWMRLEGALSATDAEKLGQRIRDSLARSKSRLVLDLQKLQWDKVENLGADHVGYQPGSHRGLQLDLGPVCLDQAGCHATLPSRHRSQRW